jgi:nitrite reductase/ring-hydroxylating ferredoxin subunit
MRAIGPFDQLPEGDATGLRLTLEDGPLDLIVLRRGRRVFAYRNVCPHRGTSLDWIPGRFLDPTQRYLQCATHGALFDPETGYCVAGPCRGDRLRAVRVWVDTEGQVCVSS